MTDHPKTLEAVYSNTKTGYANIADTLTTPKLIGPSVTRVDVTEFLETQAFR